MKTFITAFISAILLVIVVVIFINNRTDETKSKDTTKDKVSLNSSKSQTSITKGTMISSKGDTVNFYLASIETSLYWGCDDSIVPYIPYVGLYQLTSDDGTKITVVPVETQEHQNILSVALSKFITSGFSTKASFQMIFDTYNSGGESKESDIEDGTSNL